jgi:hypothetical protein
VCVEGELRRISRKAVRKKIDMEGKKIKRGTMKRRK